MFRLFLLFLQCLAALAAPWNPQITPTPSLSGSLASPVITSVPEALTGLHGEGAELKKRAYGDICGYASLDQVYPVTCAVGYQCAINTYYDAMGCCPYGDFNNCVLPTQCLGYADLSSCDRACMSNYYIGKCTAAAYPYCATYRSVLGGYTLEGYQCADIQTVLDVTGSYAGGTTSTPAIVDATPVSSPVPGMIQNFIYNNNKTEVNPPDNKSKLSKGELAGIIIGTITGVVTIIGVIVACCKR